MTIKIEQITHFSNANRKTVTINVGGHGMVKFEATTSGKTVTFSDAVYSYAGVVEDYRNALDELIKLYPEKHLNFDKSMKHFLSKTREAVSLLREGEEEMVTRDAYINNKALIVHTLNGYSISSDGNKISNDDATMEMFRAMLKDENEDIVELLRKVFYVFATNKTEEGLAKVITLLLTTDKPAVISAIENVANPEVCERQSPVVEEAIKSAVGEEAYAAREKELTELEANKIPDPIFTPVTDDVEKLQEQ